MNSIASIFTEPTKEIRRAAKTIAAWLDTDPTLIEELNRVTNIAKDATMTTQAGMHNDVADTPRDADDASGTIKRCAQILAAQSISLADTRMLPSAVLAQEQLDDDDIHILSDRQSHLSPTVWMCEMETGSAGILCASALKRFIEKPTQNAYGQFRLGLDIADIDPAIYAMLSENVCSIGHWFEPLRQACETTGAFAVPKTQIAKVPPALLQLSRLEWETLSETDFQIADAWAAEVFDLSHRDFFVKTGVRASKFDFRNAHVQGDECDEMGRYMLWLMHEGVAMSGYHFEPDVGNVRAIYGPATTNEFAIREWIADPDSNPTIYNGLPLRNEFRTFIDIDAQTCFGVGPYWDSDTMTASLESRAQDGQPEALRDLAVFLSHKDTLDARHDEHVDDVQTSAAIIASKLHELGMHGQWSLDIMLSGDTLYAIDMAPACDSALQKFAQYKPDQMCIDWASTVVRTEAKILSDHLLNSPSQGGSFFKQLLT